MVKIQDIVKRINYLIDMNDDDIDYVTIYKFTPNTLDFIFNLHDKQTILMKAVPITKGNFDDFLIERIKYAMKFYRGE